MGIWPTLALDVLCILVFAIVGRSSHGEASDLLGVLRTAWPFVVGGLLGVLIGRTWRRPGSMPAALYVWISAVVAGMTLRVVSGGTAQVSFIIVTTVVLGVFLLGWRAARRAIQAARMRRSKPA